MLVNARYTSLLCMKTRLSNGRPDNKLPRWPAVERGRYHGIKLLNLEIMVFYNRNHKLVVNRK